jgi:hypothetical protein
MLILLDHVLLYASETMTMEVMSHVADTPQHSYFANIVIGCTAFAMLSLFNFNDYPILHSTVVIAIGMAIFSTM